MFGKEMLQEKKMEVKIELFVVFSGMVSYLLFFSGITSVRRK